MQADDQLTEIGVQVGRPEWVAAGRFLEDYLDILHRWTEKIQSSPTARNACRRTFSRARRLGRSPPRDTWARRNGTITLKCARADAAPVDYIRNHSDDVAASFPLLTPAIEAAVSKFAGRVVLAKVNTDVHQDWAQRAGVRGIPNVKLIVGGRVVDEFTGALPQSAVEQFLDAVLERLEQPHVIPYVRLNMDAVA